MQLICISGLPGAGKSAIAEAIGRALTIPVFAKDWLEAVLWRNGVGSEQNSGWIGYELLTALAESQLKLGQSAIIDSVATTQSIRSQWNTLAVQYNARFCVIECLCSDELLHRARLETRHRNIPGWHELDWEEVERVRARYEVWSPPHLTIDSVNPIESNLQAALDYINS
jgi:predicted kinase